MLWFRMVSYGMLYLNPLWYVWYAKVLYGIVWYCMVLYGMHKGLILNGLVWYVRASITNAAKPTRIKIVPQSIKN